MTNQPERCRECGVKFGKHRIFEFANRAVCKMCLVALRLEAGWLERRARQAIKNKKNSELTKSWKKLHIPESKIACSEPQAPPQVFPLSPVKSTP